MTKETAGEKKSRDIDEVFEMLVQLSDRVTKLESRFDIVESASIQHASGDFERWLDSKLRGFEYGPELKAEVMPKIRGKGLQDSKKIFYECRDKLFERKYPDAPRGPKTWRW